MIDPFEFTASLMGLRGPEAYAQVVPPSPNCNSSGDYYQCGLVVFIYISGVMTFSTGIFLTVVRLFEPLFRFLVLKSIYEFWGGIYKSKDGLSEEEKQIENDTLSSFLSSSLNVELVFILLNSITTFSQRSNKLSDNNDRDFYAEAIFDDKNKKNYMNPRMEPINFEASQIAI